MNLWNKITLGSKFLFGGWESALDYLLGFLNTYLAKDGVSEKVTKVRETCVWVLDWLLKLRVYVPTKWHNEYNAITDVVADVIAVSRDNRITAAEIKALAASFAEAKQMWDED
jgi:hypothetical protein